MVSVAVLTADQRLGFQIHTWFKDLSETIRWEIHPDLAAFAQKIETEDAAEVVAQSKVADDSVVDAEDIGSGKSSAITDAYYRLLVVDLDLLNKPGQQAAEWARELKQLMLSKSRSDRANPVRMLFLAFEGGTFKVDNYRDSAIDDVVIKPLDRSVFLQKVEILTADDPAVSPTFLYRQQTSMPIEIGKDAVIEEISEFSASLRNPAPLSNGVFASMHSSVFGQGDFSRVIGRVHKSEPHPAHEGSYLVHFGLFGLRTDQITALKKYVRDRQPPHRHKPPQPNLSDQDPAVPFNRVAVIDMNADVFSEIQSTLKDNFVGVTATHYLSYARLLAALKTFYPQTTAASDASAAAPDPSLPPSAPPDDTHGLLAWDVAGPLNILALSTTEELLRIENAMSVDDKIFGRDRAQWGERGKDFFSRLDKQDANELREMFDYAASGGRGRAYMKMQDGENRLFYIEANATLAKSTDGDEGAQIRVELKQIDKDVYVKHAAEHTERQLKPTDLLFDAIYIDVNLIRGDMKPWFDGLHESYMKAGIVAPGAPMPKIILLADEKSKNQPEDYRLKMISDYLFKPLDRKSLTYKSKLAVNEFIPRKEPEIPPFVRSTIQAKLAKDAVMEEISEYGLSIAHPTAFRRGAMMRFFSPLLGGGVDGVLGRCTHCELKEDKNYLCHFMFFGTPDEILKRIRTWIREDYVNRKEAN
jgi:hypothetical protein